MGFREREINLKLDIDFGCFICSRGYRGCNRRGYFSVGNRLGRLIWMKCIYFFFLLGIVYAYIRLWFNFIYYFVVCVGV